MAGLFEVNSIKGIRKEVIELPYISEVRIRPAALGGFNDHGCRPLVANGVRGQSALQPMLTSGVQARALVCRKGLKVSRVMAHLDYMPWQCGVTPPAKM